MGEYLKHEHAHTDWPKLELEQRLDELTTNMHSINYAPERLNQVQREIGLIAFELSCRYAEEKELAWKEFEATA